MAERRGQLTTKFDPELEERWDRIYGETKRLHDEAKAQAAAQADQPESKVVDTPPSTDRDIGRNALRPQILDGPAELSLF